MKPLVLDASALLSLLFAEPGAGTVENLMHRASERDQPILMSAINWGEVCCRVEGRLGHSALAQAREFAANTPVAVVPADRELAESAAAYKTAGQLGLADAFAAALAKSHKGELVTAGPEFKSVEREIEIHWLK